MSSAEGERGITPVDHAADVGIDIRASSLEELFSRAAVGMMRLLLSDEDVARSAEPTATQEVEVEAADNAALLVSWLRELLYLHATQRFLYVAADFIELTATRLRARVNGVLHDDDVGGREIKGVTYHGLDVSERHGEWRARVIFDV